VKESFYGCTPDTCTWKQVGVNIDGEILSINGWPAVNAGFSADGLRLAYGNRYHDGERGRVRIFDYIGPNWVLVGDPMLGEEAGEGFFRCRLSGDGSTVVVGSVWFDGNVGKNAGKLTVHQLKDGKWTKIGADLVGENSGDIFSIGAINFDGSRLVASTYTWNNQRGHVKVYDYKTSTNEWEQVGLTLTGSVEGERFGGEVDISADGSRIVTGAPFYNNKAGYAAIYELQGGTWVPIKTVYGNDPNGECGARVAIAADGSRFAYACYANGKVFVYDPDTGSIVGDVITGEGSGDGIDLSNNGSRIVIASPFVDNNRGMVQLFEYDIVSNSWKLMADPIYGETVGDMEGFSVQLSGDGTKVLTDGRMHDNKRGHMRVFELQES
jgi:hypothetical protein